MSTVWLERSEFDPISSKFDKKTRKGLNKGENDAKYKCNIVV